jgi:hypothetical protein
MVVIFYAIKILPYQNLHILIIYWMTLTCVSLVFIPHDIYFNHVLIPDGRRLQGKALCGI